jgi:type V secretory pathway adhesin AidA
LIGTGARISGGDGQVVLEGVRPNAQLTAVTVTAHEDADGTTANWSVTATAICGNLPGLELVTAGYDTSEPNPSYNYTLDLEAKSGHAYCPAGKQVVGTGGQVTGQPLAARRAGRD